MGIIVFILVAGLWAAFLLPSFFDHRRRTPKATTRDFARSKEKLASVSAAQPYGDAYVRRHAERRRKRIFLVLATLAIGFLAAATIRGSVALLGVTIVIDIIIAGYVTVLLVVQQGAARPRAAIVPIQTGTAPTAEPVPEPEPFPSVRVIAG